MAKGVVPTPLPPRVVQREEHVPVPVRLQPRGPRLCRAAPDLHFREVLPRPRDVRQAVVVPPRPRGVPSRLCAARGHVYARPVVRPHVPRPVDDDADPRPRRPGPLLPQEPRDRVADPPPLLGGVKPPAGVARPVLAARGGAEGIAAIGRAMEDGACSPGEGSLSSGAITAARRPLARSEWMRSTARGGVRAAAPPGTCHENSAKTGLWSEVEVPGQLPYDAAALGRPAPAGTSTGPDRTTRGSASPRSHPPGAVVAGEGPLARCTRVRDLECGGEAGVALEEAAEDLPSGHLPPELVDPLQGGPVPEAGKVDHVPPRRVVLLAFHLALRVLHPRL
eukprot:CAMPEP_0182862082 /NCGR_PEP_ID=MMETSP0034_2-20130328/5858_1 /TAXON_ID=156128 /ORGANISM="Nephroselmis pyriformis, Strain CCMP717" /LENGTH=335 /DNA_ID=CAMNT_0024994089 /DNA_START=122 /DNA_END=1129 /DNA_ORIENTATION=+